MSPFEPSAPILTREGALSLVDSWKKDGALLVTSNGCFDLLHAGHLRTLCEARSFGDKLLVAINSDASVRRLKGAQRPLVPQEERAALLAGLRCVDAVVVFDEDTPLELLGEIRPDVHVKGGDYQKGDLPETALLESYGGRIEIIPLVPGRSTTSIAAKLEKL